MNARITTRTVSAATIARTAVLALALINQILSAAGQARAAHREHPARTAHLHRLHHRVCAGQLVVQQFLHQGCYSG